MKHLKSFEDKLDQDLIDQEKIEKFLSNKRVVYYDIEKYQFRYKRKTVNYEHLIGAGSLKKYLSDKDIIVLMIDNTAYGWKEVKDLDFIKSKIPVTSTMDLLSNLNTSINQTKHRYKKF